MVHLHRLTVAALVFAAVLVSANTASAGPIMDWLFPDDGPEPAYSPLRYWAPAVGRVNDIVHGPKISVYAPDRHPEVPPTYIILRYPCPAVEAAATLIPVPTAPETSKAH